jgi:hypothetical protein
MRWYFEDEKAQETIDRLAWLPAQRSRLFVSSSSTAAIAHLPGLPLPDPGEEKPKEA